MRLPLDTQQEGDDGRQGLLGGKESGASGLVHGLGVATGVHENGHQILHDDRSVVRDLLVEFFDEVLEGVDQVVALHDFEELEVGLEDLGDDGLEFGSH